eukprot:scaffold39917_cov49-Phaeocystis_antarctica.AAC.3
MGLCLLWGRPASATGGCRPTRESLPHLCHPMPHPMPHPTVRPSCSAATAPHVYNPKVPPCLTLCHTLWLGGAAPPLPRRAVRRGRRDRDPEGGQLAGQRRGLRARNRGRRRRGGGGRGGGGGGGEGASGVASGRGVHRVGDAPRLRYRARHRPVTAATGAAQPVAPQHSVRQGALWLYLLWLHLLCGTETRCTTRRCCSTKLSVVSCQTSKYYGSTHHDKALLARAPLTYALGFHTCAYEGDSIRREIV